MSGAVAEPSTAPPGPPPAYWALRDAVLAEGQRRQRRAVLLPALGALLAVFAFGASVLPDWITGNLLLGYLLFLAAYALLALLVLLRVYGGDYRRAVSVGELARAASERHWHERTGATAPMTPQAASDWLASHPDDAALPEETAYARLMTGDLDGMRRAVALYPRDSDADRYLVASELAVLDMLEGRPADVEHVADLAAAVSDPERRASAVASAAVLRAHVAVLAGRDWIAPLASAHPAVQEHLDEGWRVRVIVASWTVQMAIVAGLIGLALLVGRVTGVWAARLG
ncbi:MAG TPA: hypothetical protein VF013_07895 [Candidatus Limnocylindria bacterium]